MKNGSAMSAKNCSKVKLKVRYKSIMKRLWKYLQEMLKTNPRSPKLKISSQKISKRSNKTSRKSRIRKRRTRKIERKPNKLKIQKVQR